MLRPLSIRLYHGTNIKPNRVIHVPIPSRADNLDHQSLRGFLKMVETYYPDQLLRIRDSVDTRFDMTSTVFELERVGRNPVVLFERAKGFDLPVITNVAANRQLLAACLGVDTRDLPTAFRE